MEFSLWKADYKSISAEGTSIKRRQAGFPQSSLKEMNLLYLKDRLSEKEHNFKLNFGYT